jgi:peptidoglycan/LPS O-acetylase OafA/YrhL
MSLDAWRGVASLAVCLQHVAVVDVASMGVPLAAGPAPARMDLHIGAPAVMMFFVISGYCIASSADPGDGKTTELRSFMGRRVRRIWPPYLLSIAFWVITRATKVGAGGSNQLARPLHVWLQNLTLTQWLSDLSPFAPQPKATFFVTTYWSLCYEEQFYLVVGLLFAFVGSRRKRLWCIASIIAASIAWNAAGWGSAIFVRYWFHFGLGVGVFYVQCHGGRIWRAALGGCLVAGLIGSSFAAETEARTSMVCAMAFALFVLAGRRLTEPMMGTAAGRLLRGLGAISFSLYLVHYPVVGTVCALTLRALPVRTPLPLFWLVQLTAHVAIATGFWYCCERPFLHRMTEGRRCPSPAAWKVATSGLGPGDVDPPAISCDLGGSIVTRLLRDDNAQEKLEVLGKATLPKEGKP